MLAPELQRLSEAIQNLRGLAELRSLLEYGPGALPVRHAKRLTAEAQELVRPPHNHRRPCSHERAVGLPRKRSPRCLIQRSRVGRRTAGRARHLLLARSSTPPLEPWQLNAALVDPETDQL